MGTNIITSKVSLLVLTLLLSGTMAVNAQNRTKVNILMGIADPALKSRIETNSSAVLTEINSAFVENRRLREASLSGLSTEGREIILDRKSVV